ncbi:MAG: baseplate J/gp47 family protein, partial [Oscillospiraceae bacterium]
NRDILQRVAQGDGGLSVLEGSFADGLAGPVALELRREKDSQQALVPIAFVDETSGIYLEKRAAEFGLAKKPGIFARGTVSFAGTAGVTVPAGTALLTAGGLEYSLDADVVLTGSGGVGRFTAVAVGNSYNVGGGAICQLYVNLPGIASFTASAATGGADEESDEALFRRLCDYRQKPSTSGNIHDYEKWALEVPGIGKVRVTPLWNGNGTVKVLLAGTEFGVASDRAVAAATENIEGKRPIGPAVTVLSAAALTVNVAATVTADGSVALADIQREFVSDLDTYLKSLVFAAPTLLFNRVAFLLLSIPGVTDYKTLTVNGGSVNVAIGAEQVPVLGTVTVA